MRRQFGVGLCALLVGASGAGAAPGKDVACALLTASEIGAAVGGPAAEPHESDMAIGQGPHKGETMPMCMWQVGQEGMVTVSPFRLGPGDDRAAALRALRQSVDTLKAQGWSEEKKTLGGVECSLLSPPQGQKDAPFTTGCFGETGGKGVAVSWLGRKSVPIDRIKTLFGAAVARLP